MKQFAPACERNRQPILTVLQEIMTAPGTVLEIASGTGQHAAFFSAQLPHLVWQPTEQPPMLASIAAYREDTGPAANLRPPLALDLGAVRWPLVEADYVVCINTIHIVAWQLVEKLFAGAAAALPPDGLLYVYGPYRYRDRPLEPSNTLFDQALRARDPTSGIRCFEQVDELAGGQGLNLAGDRPMPANNRSIWWRKATA